MTPSAKTLVVSVFFIGIVLILGLIGCFIALVMTLFGG